MGKPPNPKTLNDSFDFLFYYPNTAPYITPIYRLKIPLDPEAKGGLVPAVVNDGIVELGAVLGCKFIVEGSGFRVYGFAGDLSPKKPGLPETGTSVEWVG